MQLVLIVIFLFTFIIKIIGKIPHEITNLFLGALKIHYVSYIFASLLALLPTMLSITFMAKNYDDPSSPVFIVSLAIFLIMPIISFIIYFSHRDSNKNEKEYTYVKLFIRRATCPF